MEAWAGGGGETEGQGGMEGVEGWMWLHSVWCFFVDRVGRLDSGVGGWGVPDEWG